jgi:hypothetical protein
MAPLAATTVSPIPCAATGTVTVADTPTVTATLPTTSTGGVQYVHGLPKRDLPYQNPLLGLSGLKRTGSLAVTFPDRLSCWGIPGLATSNTHTGTLVIWVLPGLISAASMMFSTLRMPNA